MELQAPRLKRAALMGLLSLCAAAALVNPARSAPPAAPATQPASELGANVPWVSVEAELSKSMSGQVLGPDFTGQTPAREASGRKCVALSATGQYLELTAPRDAQGLVIRYCIPDSADGAGTDATLDLSINGKFIQKLALTSRYNYLYGEYPFSNDPAAGKPRNFWNEVHLLNAVHSGDTIRLEKKSDDSAAQYLIDMVDFETVPPPLDRPADALSVADFGATANDETDDRPAFLSAIAAAKQQHKAVFIPPGQFVIRGSLDLSDITITGAGMWHSTLVGTDDYSSANRVSLTGVGSNIALSDFAILGKLNYRNDEEPNEGLVGSFGTGSTIRNIWVEHTKTGAWLTNSSGLLVENCRFRDTIADGINLCLGMQKTVVKNCTARGGGDDCFAMWPATYLPAKYPHGGNLFVHCTAQLPFLAQGFSIYGGDSNAVRDCQATDIPYGAGAYASTTFPTVGGFSGTSGFQNLIMTRTGGSDGAIGTVANRLDLSGLLFENIAVIDSATDGIKFISMDGHELSDATFKNIQIKNPGQSGAGCGIVAASGAAGSATLDHVSVTNAKTVGVKDDSPAFKLVRGGGNSGF